DYPIEKGTVRLFWPAEARLNMPVEIDGPALPPSDLAHGVAIDVANYNQRDDDVRLTVRFAPGVFTGAEPRWERDARRAERMAPA
ncbi:hypothetical protein OVX45_27815, partial [Klebsiella pneumoniae]|uniref:hypothetical protein n=1 Tax=Klebsiella pneumoniae TaxID=573 RepID=UPI002270B7DC